MSKNLVFMMLQVTALTAILSWALSELAKAPKELLLIMGIKLQKRKNHAQCLATQRDSLTLYRTL